MSEVVFEGVTKRFGDVEAVKGLDLEILDGEFMVLLGPSGCGKSTALRCIAGLDDISEGAIRIGDRVVNEVEARHRDISMVFQSYALYPHLTVAKNIESPLLARKFTVEPGSEPRKLNKAERAERVAEAARILGLTDLLDRKPGALSGGQRQRVALGRAIVSRPKAFLFDEPLSNLDAKLRGETRLELVALHERLATTFVYVTHDQVEAMTMADRIAILEGGELQQVGPPQAVYERPANLFVARFIGSPAMNTATGVVRIIDGEPWIELDESNRIRIAALEPEPLAEGTKVIMGVRPEHISIADDGPASMTVEAVEWLGHERHVVGRLADERITVREAAEGPGPQVGDVVRLAAAAEDVHLFDPNTTRRLS